MLLSCPLCCKPHFKGVDSLRATLVNVATALLTCPVCQETLKGLDKLTIHLFGHVNNGGNSDGVSRENVFSAPVSPSNCNIRDQFHTSQGNINSLTNQKTTPKSQEIITKQQENEAKDNDVIICDICSFTFTDRNILDMHQKLLHQTTPDEKTGKYSYHCHLCSKRFRMRGSLMVHLRVAHYGFSNHSEFRPRLLNSENNVTNFPEDRTMEIVSEAKNTTKPQDCKQWSCDVCAKMFTTKYFLRKHKRLHTGEMPYSCTICSKSFTFQQSYHKHMLYHSSEKPYVCNECGRAFKEHSTLQNHARIHSGERPFGCEICGKRFRQRVSYLVHKRIHTGVLPYKCTACNKSFRYKVSQRSHKCLLNPPGSVIQINELDTKSSLTLPSANLNVDENQYLLKQSDLNISLMENMEPQNTIGNKEAKCIMTVDYDTGNINIIPETVKENNAVCDRNKNYQAIHQPALILKLEEDNQNKLITDGSNKECLLKQRDQYSMMLSPILSDVESLCINNNCPISPANSPIEDELIREKCLEELFK